MFEVARRGALIDVVSSLQAGISRKEHHSELFLVMPAKAGISRKEHHSEMSGSWLSPG
jgi:hypothetical protein